MSRHTLPLNPAQKWLLASGSSPFASLTQVSLSFGEAMNREEMQRAWQTIYQSHPALRMRFEKEEQMRQYVADSDAFSWEDIDWASTNPAEVGSKWFDLLKADREKPFAEKDSALSRFHLITLPGGSSHLLWTFSDMLADKESIHLIVREFLQCYEGGELTSEEDDGWRQFAEWVSASQEGKQALISDNSDEAPGISLLDHTEVENSPLWEKTYLLNPDRLTNTQNFADNLQVPLSVILEASWAIVVARLSGKEDIVYMRNYTARGLLLRHDTVGRFTASVPVPIHIDDGAKSGDWIRSLFSAGKLSGFPVPPSTERKEILSAATHFELRTEELITESPRWVRLDVRIHPSTSCRSLRIEWDGSPTQPLKFSSTEAYFPSGRYQELIGYFEHAIDALTRTPNRLLWDVSILSRSERAQLIEKSSGKNATECLTLLDLLDHACAQHSTHPAVIIGTESLNFQELNDYASRFAKYLKNAGFQKGDLILFNLHATSWFWVALLGSLKIGAIAVPLRPDETVPQQSQNFPAEAKAVICDSSTHANSENFAANSKVIAIDQSWHDIYASEPLESSFSPSPDSPAVAFPSDQENESLLSFSHRSIAGASKMLSERLRLRSSDRLPRLRDSSLIGFYEELFAAMHAGATVVLDAPPAGPDEWSAWLDAMQINAIYCETAKFDSWVLSPNAFPLPATLRIVASRGDLPSGTAISSWKNNAPKEMEKLHFWAADRLSVISLELKEDSADIVSASICANAMAYVLDGPRIAPDGTRGELAIGGYVLATQKPELPGGGKYTAERDTLSVKEIKRLRCGIVARRSENGSILANFPRYSPPTPKKIAKPVLAAPAPSQGEAPLPVESEILPVSPSPKDMGNGLVWLREAEGKPVLFIIHPGKSGAETYYPLLAHLPEDISCAVLTTTALRKGEELFVETLANRYLEILESTHPEGSWHVAAFGNGAWIAWEMTQILALKNREFATMAIIDAVPPKIAGLKGLLQGVSFGKKRDGNSLLAGESPAWPQSYRTYEGPAKLHVFSKMGASTLGWKTVAPACQPHEIKMTGESFLENPQIKSIADFFANRMRRIRPRAHREPAIASSAQQNAAR